MIAAVIVIVIVIVSRPQQTSPEIQQTFNQIAPSKPTTLFFAGDIMLSRNVDQEILKANNPNLPFLNVASQVQQADIAFANLESQFAQNAIRARQGLVFGAHPDVARGLSFAGFDVLSTANNHSLDYGIESLEYTIDLLNQYNIQASGTKKPATEHAAAIIEKNGIVFGFLSYSYAAHNDGGPPAGEAGRSTHTQISDFNNLDRLRQDILDIKGHYADIVIVSMHAGAEYTREPNQKQIDFAHGAIDAGADLVIGHHPHWIQTIEQYQGKWIFYSLGNFVFDQMWSIDTREGLTVTITMTMPPTNVGEPRPSEIGGTMTGPEIKKIELKPVIIDNYCCPRWATETETLAILGKLGLTSVILLDKND